MTEPTDSLAPEILSWIEEQVDCRVEERNADHAKASQAELDDLRTELTAACERGLKALHTVAPGIEAAARVLFKDAHGHKDPSRYQTLHDHRGHGYIAVPAWYAFRYRAEAVISAYLADIGQPPL